MISQSDIYALYLISNGYAPGYMFNQLSSFYQNRGFVPPEIDVGFQSMIHNYKILKSKLFCSELDRCGFSCGKPLQKLTGQNKGQVACTKESRR